MVSMAGFLAMFSAGSMVTISVVVAARSAGIQNVDGDMMLV